MSFTLRKNNRTAGGIDHAIAELGNNLVAWVRTVIPINSSGAEIFTVANPGRVAMSGSISATVDTITEVTNITSLDTVDEVTNITSVDLVDGVTLVDDVLRVADVGEIANVVNVAELANVTSVDEVDLVTEVNNVTSVDLVDSVATVIEVLAVGEVSEVANVTSVDTVDDVTSVDTVDEVTLVTSVTTVGTVSTVSALPSAVQGPGNPTVDSYSHASVTLAANTANQVLVASPGANKQIWVYGLLLVADTAAGTIAIQDEDDTAITGAVAASDEGGYHLPLSGNFAMPWFKVATAKALEADTVTCSAAGVISYAVVSV